MLTRKSAMLAALVLAHDGSVARLLRNFRCSIVGPRASQQEPRLIWSPLNGDLEAFNRVVACCAASVAQHLLANAGGHDAKTVHRVAGALLAWSAALGDPASRTAIGGLPTNAANAVPSIQAAGFSDLPPWLH